MVARRGSASTGLRSMAASGSGRTTRRATDASCAWKGPRRVRPSTGAPHAVSRSLRYELTPVVANIRAYATRLSPASDRSRPSSSTCLGVEYVDYSSLPILVHA